MGQFIDDDLLRVEAIHVHVDLSAHYIFHIVLKPLRVDLFHSLVEEQIRIVKSIAVGLWVESSVGLRGDRSGIEIRHILVIELEPALIIAHSLRYEAVVVSVL